MPAEKLSAVHDLLEMLIEPPSHPVALAAVDEQTSTNWLAGLHRLKGMGKELWTEVDPDDYVRSLR